MSADGVATKKRSVDDGETNVVKEARIVRGLTSIAVPLSKGYFDSVAEKTGHCAVCAESQGKQKRVADKDAKFGWCYCCRERACQTHLRGVRDSNICTACCAAASLCARCRCVTIGVTIAAERAEGEFCVLCAKVLETRKKNADLVLIEAARPVTDKAFAELLENCDAVYDEDEERPSCGLCDETCVVICDWCGDSTCQKHLHEVLADGEHVCTSCLPEAKFCTSCKNALGDLESGLCNDCKWIEISRREKLECDYCKKQVEVRDTERVEQEGNACFDCTYQKKIKQL
jgi:hypothetical protein